MDRYPYWSYRSLKWHVDNSVDISPHIVYKLLLLLLEILYVVCI